MAAKFNIVFVGLALFAGGCARYPMNAPLTAVDSQTGYRFTIAAPRTNSDELLLMLAFSGGGTRAAALAYGVLEELARTKAGPPGQEHRVLDEVDLISCVSGGSFTAACYGLWGDRIFSDFEAKFLKKHVQSGLLLRSLSPWSRVRLASSKFNTSDLAAEYYDRLLFRGATFGDLASNPNRPFIIINSTDAALGARFEFTQDEFDLIRSDLSQFPISRAVAASSAFPVWLSPVVLKNHSTKAGCAEPDWVRLALADPGASSRLRNMALEAESYLDGERRPFVHLFDGGIADNLGLRGLVERALVRTGTAIPSESRMPNVRQIAVIIVDARTDHDYGWDSKEGSPGLKAVIGTLSSVSLNRYSFETIELFRETTARLEAEAERARANGHSSQPTRLNSYIIELHFNQLANQSDREFFNSVPTRFQLPSSTVDRLKRLAGSQLGSNAEFRRLLRDIQM